MSWYGGFAPYVSVAQRRRKAETMVAALKKKGQTVQPVVVAGRTIARTFWGKAWCEHLESYSDYENRLPRGRTYVRNGSVIDLQMAGGKISALVSGSSIYKVNITIAAVAKKRWHNIIKASAGQIDSLIELLQGKLSRGVMEIITHPDQGLFPHPKDIRMKCSCPDWADMCKHIAAVLYGVGARLDENPEALFLLRQADHTQLISSISAISLVGKGKPVNQTLANEDLSALFGIDLDNNANSTKAEKITGGGQKSKKDQAKERTRKKIACIKTKARGTLKK